MSSGATFAPGATVPGASAVKTAERSSTIRPGRGLITSTRDPRKTASSTLLDGADGDREESLVLAGERVLLVQLRDASPGAGDVGAVMILRDRTELAATLRSLEGERDTAQALRAQSHEFSNRMHVVSGLLELGRTDDAVRFISRGVTTAVPAKLQAPDVRDPELMALLLQKAHLGAERGITVRLDPSSEHAFEGTSDVLTVVANLVDNAMEALVQDGTVEVSVHHEDEHVVVRVSDDGPGLAGQDPEQIFRAGVSGKSNQGRARGIGLALVSRIAQRRGGGAWAREGGAGGLEVEVRLREAGRRADGRPVMPAGAGRERGEA